MKRCPYCARRTFHAGFYCGLCARVVWDARLIGGLLLTAAMLLIALFLAIDYFSAVGNG